MLNTQAIKAIMDGERIKSAFCWQSTTETEVVINAKIFVDCSGDGLLLQLQEPNIVLDAKEKLNLREIRSG